MPRKPSTEKLRRLIASKNSLSEDGKKKLLRILHLMKECGGTGNVGGETDITNADNLVAEDEFTASDKPERNPIAKTFDTEADFDGYVNQRRGIEMTAKELQAIKGYTKASPTKQDKFSVKYENTDNFGTNSTTVIKKLKEGNQFCWTAFSTYRKAEDEGKPVPPEEPPEPKNTPEATPPTPSVGAPVAAAGKPPIKEAAPVFTSKPAGQAQTQPQTPTQPQKPDESTIGDPIRITKSITFLDENDGANILGDFLRNVIKVPTVN